MGAYGSRRPAAKLGLWWGYLPLVLVSSLVVAMVVFVPSEVPDGGVSADGGPQVNTDGQPASGWGETVQACAGGQERQVADDGYAPPCFEFTGDNGGATAPGVTADTITVTYRMTPDNNLLKILADYLEVPFDEPPERMVETAEGLVDYFNQNFQFYGRRLELKRLEGSGSVIAEFTGGGQEAAGADAIKATELGAFADMTGITQSYSEALTRQKVVNVGAPYMSREWFAKQRPYAWSTFPDCSTASEVSSEIGVKSVIGRPADYAGGDLAGRTRTLGIIVPENLEYQQCRDSAVKYIEDAGLEVAHTANYVLDLGRIDTQADAIIAQLKDKGITSVACGCDPLMVSALARKADEVDYQPEWLIIGVGFVDLDLVGQMISKHAPEQWARAFGGSPWGAQQAVTDSAGYKAFKSVRPDEEPSLLTDIIYYQLYELVIGIQMAGPDLTPQTFESGMFAYPEGTGPAGTWDFSPERYTGVVDARLLWWDPDAPSPFNGDPGTYIDTGTRYRSGEFPDGEIEVFG
jgi:hypothetical protein